MDDPPQLARLISMLPQDAAVPILPCLRAGAKHAVDFDTPLWPALLGSIILRHFDGSSSAMLWAL